MDQVQAYVRAAAALLNLPLEPYEAEVVTQFARLQKLAAGVMAFPDLDQCPPALRFAPEPESETSS
jgi:hypothetical protein